MRTPMPWNIPHTPFTFAQAARTGVTRAQLRTALTDGRVIRLRHGVFISAAVEAQDELGAHLQRALAQQFRSPGLFLDRTSAALAHGLPLQRPGHVLTKAPSFLRVASPRVRGGTRAGRAVRVTSALPSHHVARLPSGLVVTSRARTAVDVAAGSDFAGALMVLDAAAHMELADMVGRPRRAYRDPRALEAATRPLLEAAHTTGLAARLARPLRLADPRRESPLESFSAAHFAEAGIPRPTHQAQIRTPQGDYFPDNLWAEYRLIGEADGQGKYEDPAAATKEKLRDADLRDLGYELLHWAGAEMFPTPVRVVDRVGRMLVARGWDGVPKPW